MVRHERQPRLRVPFRPRREVRCLSSYADYRHHSRGQKSSLARRLSSLESKDQFASEGARRAVEELSEAGAIQVVLYVSRIEMIQEIEDAQPHFEFAFLGEGESKFFEHLNIERVESAEALIVPS